jgi:hypothetical protein
MARGVTNRRQQIGGIGAGSAMRTADTDQRSTWRRETHVSERISTTKAQQEGFYWVILGQNPPEIGYWERGEWWLAGDAKPWQPEAVTVASDRLAFAPRLTPVA